MVQWAANKAEVVALINGELRDLLSEVGAHVPPSHEEHQTRTVVRGMLHSVLQKLKGTKPEKLADAAARHAHALIMLMIPSPQRTRKNRAVAISAEDEADKRRDSHLELIIWLRLLRNMPGRFDGAHIPLRVHAAHAADHAPCLPGRCVSSFKSVLTRSCIAAPVASQPLAGYMAGPRCRTRRRVSPRRRSGSGSVAAQGARPHA
jgi:hypothetical protein